MRAQYQLVGTVLGLALYNGVILDVRFPSLTYRRVLDYRHQPGGIAAAQLQRERLRYRSHTACHTRYARLLHALT